MAKYTTVMSTLSVLRHLFAVYGLPEQVVSDNGPQFSSEVFTKFLQANGVKHSRCSPYHPLSNRAVECFVRTFKQAMKAGKFNRLSRLDINLRTSSCTTEQHHTLQLEYITVSFMDNISVPALICSKLIWQRMSITSKQFRKLIMIDHAKARVLDVGQ